MYWPSLHLAVLYDEEISLSMHIRINAVCIFPLQSTALRPPISLQARRGSKFHVIKLDASKQFEEIV